MLSASRQWEGYDPKDRFNTPALPIREATAATHERPANTLIQNKQMNSIISVVIAVSFTICLQAAIVVMVHRRISKNEWLAANRSWRLLALELITNGIPPIINSQVESQNARRIKPRSLRKATSIKMPWWSRDGFISRRIDGGIDVYWTQVIQNSGPFYIHLN